MNPADQEIRDVLCEFVDRVVALAVETIHEFTRKDTKKCWPSFCGLRPRPRCEICLKVVIYG
jgi:hypothetical protein